MSDGSTVLKEHPGTDQSEHAAAMGSRLKQLEQLLGNVAQHLNASGNRHGDVVAQLQDRLRHLQQTTASAPATPNLDRHLALFEAQLTSLAIRTGVPTPPQPARQAAPPAGAPVRQQFESAPPPLTQPAPSAGIAPNGLPIPKPPPAPAPQFSPQAEPTLRPAAAAAPIGAPPPTMPSNTQPGLDVLTRQSDFSFEDAVAADRAAEALANAHEVEETEQDQIFAYHPPASLPTDTPSVLEVPADDISSETLVSADMADVPLAAPEFDAEEISVHTDDIVDASPSMPEADTPEPSASSTLRSELEAAINAAAKTGGNQPQDPVVYRAEPDEVVLPEPVLAATPIAVAEPEAVPATKISAEPEPAAMPDGVDVLGEIARLTRQVDTVTASVERIEQGLEDTRAEVPDLIEKAAQAAAAKAAERVSATDTGVNRRIDELHDLLDARLSTTAAPAPVAQATSNTVVDRMPKPEEAPSGAGSAFGQAKQSMLNRLAPVGNALARRAKRAEKSADGNDLAQAHHDAMAYSADSQTIHNGMDHTYAEERDTTTQQPMSNLRRSLFDSLKDGSPSALVLVFGIITVLSGALLWNIVSGTPATTEKTAITASRTAPAAQVAEVDRLDITNSTSALSENAARETQTTGALQPTSGRINTDFGEPPPIKPTALKPGSDQPPGTVPTIGESKLELPPLATGPLSLRMAAASGDADAQFEVASRLAQGNGVERDSVAAVKWYTRAASAGHPRAQYRLAALYERGTGVATDTGRAKIWYTRAAQQGNVKAMHNLAVLYAGQAAGSPNYVNAAQWFERAAEHGLADSQFNVAILYLNGLGVSKNLRTAYKWFALAAKQGDQEATRRLNGVAAQLSASELAAAKDVVKAWRATPAREESNKAVAWRPKSTSRKVAPTLANRIAPTKPEPQKTSNVIGEAEIKKVQRLLNGLGYDAGTPDGRVGGKTKASIKSFQTRNGMIPTGTVDQALIYRIEGVVRERAAKLNRT